MTGCSAPVLDGAKAVKADVGFETIEFKGLRATASQNAKDAMSKSNQTGLEVFEIIYNKDREINQLISPISLIETVDAMNKWVEDHTGGLLKETFKEFDPATVAALINTLYFKGTWRNDFNESLTAEMPFELNDGTNTNVDMMQTQGHFPYLETDSAQILSMSYHGDGASI